MSKECLGFQGTRHRGLWGHNEFNAYALIKHNMQIQSYIVIFTGNIAMYMLWNVHFNTKCSIYFILY